MGSRLAFGREYGAGPVHLLSLLASLAVAGWAVLRVSDLGFVADFALWVVGAALLHDLVLLPLYSLLDRAAIRATGARGPSAPRPARRVDPINHLRVPALLSGLLLVLFFPLILGLAEDRYAAASGLGTDVYLEHWLILTGILFALSGVLLVGRLRRASTGRPRPRGRP